METIYTNAILVLDDRLAPGTLVVRDGVIAEVSEGTSALPGAQDCEGDFLAPGLIDLHTDALEGHFVPRPKVIWPDARAAALAHDGQVVASGVTTVYDAISAGGFDQAKSGAARAVQPDAGRGGGDAAPVPGRSPDPPALRADRIRAWWTWWARSSPAPW